MTDIAEKVVTYDEVVKIAEALEQAGERITIIKVRNALGNCGNTTVITKFLKEWKSKRDSKVDPVVKKPVIKEPIIVKKTTASKIMAVKASQKEVEQTDKIEPSINGEVIKSATKKMVTKTNSSGSYKSAQSRVVNKNTKPTEDKNEPIDLSVDYTAIAETLNEKELRILIRRLESMLMKEQSRSDSAEKQAQDAKEYAGIIKEQIAQRINDVRLAMEESIQTVKAEAREAKRRAEEDLKYYREHLEVANNKIMELSK